jgi:hypothetical protein
LRATKGNVVSLDAVRKAKAGKETATRKGVDGQFVDTFAELTLLWSGPEAYRRFCRNLRAQGIPVKGSLT